MSSRVTMKRRTVWTLAEAREALERLLGHDIGSNWIALDGYLTRYIATPEQRATVIASALSATLEMVREGKMALRQEQAFGALWVKPRSGRTDEPEPAEADMPMSQDANMLAIAERLHAELAEARDHLEAVRIAEALLFASAEPLPEDEIAQRLPAGVDIERVMNELARCYAGRGVNCVCIAGKWAFRTAQDLGHVLERQVQEPRKLSRAAMETLAIIAYHQPVTRAEIEEIRGVSTSKGTLDTLIEAGWARLRGRRRTPGRPVTYGTTPAFLDHFGLEQISDLPGLEELKGAGFIEGRIPPGMSIPSPSDDETLHEDEEPLDDGDLFMPLPIEGEDDAAGDADIEADDDPLEDDTERRRPGPACHPASLTR